MCHRCARRRCERREVLAELLETEVRYGRDLRVLQDELYKPLLVAGLVPLRQLGKKTSKKKMAAAATNGAHDAPRFMEGP